MRVPGPRLANPYKVKNSFRRACANLSNRLKRRSNTISTELVNISSPLGVPIRIGEQGRLLSSFLRDQQEQINGLEGRVPELQLGTLKKRRLLAGMLILMKPIHADLSSQDLRPTKFGRATQNILKGPEPPPVYCHAGLRWHVDRHSQCI